MTPRLKELYYKEIQPQLKEQLGFKNTYMGPKLQKVVINMGLGLDGADAKIMKSTEEDLGKITGQKPTVTKFKKSVANFKTRKGTNAGLKVTLRGNKMYEFIDRLVNIALPRIKDFRGLSPKGFDKFGNYTFGIKEHIIFPEVNFDRIDKIRGLDVVVVISAMNKALFRNYSTFFFFCCFDVFFNNVNSLNFCSIIRSINFYNFTFFFSISSS